MQNFTLKLLFTKNQFKATNFYPFLTLLLFFSFSKVAGQTPGLIYEPATGASSNVLDPDSNGFTSKTTAGFIGDDQTDSEIPFNSLIFPMLEPTSDLGPGPDCGFTDFVDQGDQDPVQSYLNGGNWLFRMRMGNNAPNAKSYSILIDTDGKFGGTGPNRDPEYSSLNPGFEIEIVLATRKGVYIYDVNNMNCTPVKKYEDVLNIHYQKSIALTTACGNPDYFYDFYVEFSDLTALFGITTATPVRMAVVSNMAADKSTLCSPTSASDLAGIDDASCGSVLENCLIVIIDNYTPCAPGAICPDRSLCPGINNVNTGATTVSGTSSEANGTVIAVYKDGVLIGSTTVNAGIWTLSSISPALVTGNVITATATAPTKGTSIANCNAKTVTSCASVTTAPAAGDITKISGAKGYSVVVNRPIGTIVRCYNANGTLIDPSPAGLNLAAPDNFNTVTTTSSPQTVLFKCQTGNCFGNFVYFFTYQEPGKCESSRTYDCQYSTATATATPTISTSPVLTSTTSVSGTVIAPDNIVGVTVNLIVNGIQLGTTTTTAGGAWTISGLSLTSLQCQTLSVLAIAPSKCVSASVTSTIQRQAFAPAVNGPICVSSAVTSVSGTSNEASGTIIQVYENGIAEGSTTTVSSTGTWTASTGINIALGSTITAKASTSCLSLSAASNSVVVGTKSSNTVAITTSPIYECSASVSGTGTNGDVISLYIDGVQIGTTANVSGGLWTISGLDTYCDLYTGGVVTAKATTGTNCEGIASAGVAVVCVNPLNNQVVTPATTTICSGSTAAVTVQNSESGIIYQLYNGASTSATSKLGTGSNMVLISGILTSSTTLTVKSIRIGTSCSATLSNSVSVTVTTVDSTITESSGVLTATQNGATYQWYQCPSTLISGQTNQSFTPSVAGDYKASVTVGGCSVTTNCFSVVLSATDFDNTTFSYYPNPTNGILNINYSETISKIQVSNLLGQEVLSKIINNKQGQIDMQHLPSGTYFVKVASEDKVKTLKIVRE